MMTTPNKILRAAAGFPLALLTSGCFQSYDLPKLNQHAADGRVILLTTDQAERVGLSNFRWERRDPSTFDIVVRQDRPPEGRERTEVQVDIDSSAHHSRVTATCGRTEPCRPRIVAHLDSGAVATVQVVDYDACGKPLKSATYSFPLKRVHRVSLPAA